MKHGKSPSVKQKKFMASQQLNPNDWLVERDTPKEMVLISRCEKEKLSIKKHHNVGKRM